MKSIGFLGKELLTKGDLFRFEIRNFQEFAMFLAYIPAIYKEIQAFDHGWFVDVWCSADFAEEVESNFNLEFEAFSKNGGSHVEEERILSEIDEAYQALENLENYEPTSWNGIMWDGNPDNTFGWDCVYSAIWESINLLYDELNSEFDDDIEEFKEAIA